MFKSSTQAQPEEFDAAIVTNSVLVIALSNIGKGYEWKVLDNLSNCSSAYSISLVFNIKYSKYGWRYTARETTTKLAIVDMLAYRILVLGHILYSAISGASSTA